ncbi:hypothetical protein, partial [Pseudomonas syringae group genomosp. 7]|uniref:hypothetical protein n=1 Tax=Pseudomonas syringae group genomosp. 7 TaxID=251699 RepID=UPI0037704B40
MSGVVGDLWGLVLAFVGVWCGVWGLVSVCCGCGGGGGGVVGGLGVLVVLFGGGLWVGSWAGVVVWLVPGVLHDGVGPWAVWFTYQMLF